MTAPAGHTPGPDTRGKWRIFDLTLEQGGGGEIRALIDSHANLLESCRLLLTRLEREGIDNIHMSEARERIDHAEGSRKARVERSDAGGFEVRDDGSGPYWFGGCPGGKDSLRFAVGEALELEPGSLSWPVGSRVYGWTVEP